MKKKIIITLSLSVLILSLFYAFKTFGLFRNSAGSTGTLETARWSVTRSHSTSSDSLEVIPGIADDTYTLTVESMSEVDVTYTIIISNLPAGVEVILDNHTYTPSNNTVRIPNAGTINYNDQEKIQTRVLTFRAVSGAQTVSDQEIDIDVEFKQIIQ